VNNASGCLGLVAAAAGLSLLAGDWLAGAAVLVLAGIWFLLWRLERAPVLFLALGYQWAQTCFGMLYYAVTGTRIPTMDQCDYRTFVGLGLAGVASVAVGLFAGLRCLAPAAATPRTRSFVDWNLLAPCYLLSIPLSGLLSFLAWEYPQFTQPLLMLSVVHLALLFLVFRRLSYPRPYWGLLAVVLAFEIALGLLSFFAAFREPLVLLAIALAEHLDTRRGVYWFALASLAGIALLISIVWQGIKGEYRHLYYQDRYQQSFQERLDLVGGLIDSWFDKSAPEVKADVDRWADRMWPIYFPALAVERVPDVLPHTNGHFTGEAIYHLATPRFFNPEKQRLVSESEKVRTYSGVWVAGDEAGVNIAFGYVAEAYIDFGVPMMLIPMLCFGFAMGLAYRLLQRLIRDRDLAAATLTVTFWVSLYLFERSWVKMLGTSGMVLLTVGGAAVLVDRLLGGRPRAAMTAQFALPRAPAAKAAGG
jgi:hypothetical protein